MLPSISCVANEGAFGMHNMKTSVKIANFNRPVMRLILLL